ncbi:MAG TPA: SEC-C metal-binding domain-containing protein, partial [Gemmatimonadaceae bacterium]
SFALEGGEELKGEALKMIDKAITHRVDTTLAEFDETAQWDFELLKQDLLIHYLLGVPELEQEDLRPIDLPGAQRVAIEAARKAFWAKLESLDVVRDETGSPYGGRLLSLVMLNVLDEKWKDHLYDLDQLRNSIHYRSWGQKDPLIEYKHEAYTMFVDLMNDIYNTFSERFLKVQLLMEPAAPGPVPPPQDRPKKRYNALGILEDVPPDDGAGAGSADPDATSLDIGPAQPPSSKPVSARKDPLIVGAGRTRSFSDNKPPADTDWSNVGRNDPCPCGSGKKFKKCHGANL